jgi:hypothetical protein
MSGSTADVGGCAADVSGCAADVGGSCAFAVPEPPLGWQRLIMAFFRLMA